MNSYSDKRMLITGASKGLGKAASIAFEKLGVQLALAARSKEKLYDLVTNDYYIFENQKKYTMQEFLEFVSTFNIIEDNWELTNFDINTDYNSAHVTLNNKGKFIVQTLEGKVKMEFDWLESAYLIKENDELKFKFYFSDAVNESTIPLE